MGGVGRGERTEGDDLLGGLVVDHVDDAYGGTACARQAERNPAPDPLPRTRDERPLAPARKGGRMGCDIEGGGEGRMESDGVHARKRGGGDQGADAVTGWIALHRLKLQSKSGDLVESTYEYEYLGTGRFRRLAG